MLKFYAEKVYLCSMNRLFSAILLLTIAATAVGQPVAKVLKQQSLKRYGIPAGNYSGITHLGGSRYAVCDDKAPDGFFVWDIDVDTVSEKIRQVRNEGFHASGCANRDAEGIAYAADIQTVFMASEQDGKIYAYAPDGQPKPTESPVLLDRFSKNTGLEGLTYDRQRRCLWAMEENGGEGHCRLLRLDHRLATLQTLHYPLDAPVAKKKGLTHVHGVSAVCALDDGRLLVLEREAWVPKKKIGAWVRCKLYVVSPQQLSEKQLVAAWRSRLNLTARSWANYEGMCLGPRMADGRCVLILLSDSQNRYGGVLQDRIRTVLLTLPATEAASVA